MAAKNLKSRVEAGLFGTRLLQNMAMRWIRSRNALLYSDFGDHGFVYDPSEFIGRTIFETGVFQRRNVEIVLEKCLQSGARANGVFLEIGANIGTQTVYANLTHRFSRIIAVEPDPVNLRALHANIRLNGFDDRASVIACGISDREGELILRRNRLHSGMSTVEEPRPGAVQPDVDGEFVIPIVTADALLDRQGVDPAQITLIWRDIEGHEPKALRGMSRILGARPPLFFEYAPHRMSEDELDFIDTQVLAGYGQVFSFANDQLRELDAERRRDIRKLTAKIDILAIHNG